ncbi:MAG TPA: hypothetical protein VF407_08850 [Polyangiaceae bacterium]
MSNNAHTWLRIAAVGLIAALQYFPHRHHDGRGDAASKARNAAQTTLATTVTATPAVATGTEVAAAP